MKPFSTILLATLLGANTLHAAQVTATIYPTADDKNAIGEVVFTDSPFGLLITPNLKNLPAGAHGFHLHQHPNCGDHGMSAGEHFDPATTKTHQGPYGKGHLGDLPVLFVTDKGLANTPLLAPRLKLSDLHGLTVMIHADGDNYSDTPALGGGGAREACGVIN